MGDEVQVLLLGDDQLGVLAATRNDRQGSRCGLSAT
jgi:hypothetical protein